MRATRLVALSILFMMFLTTPAHAASPTKITGFFDAEVDFSTLRLTAGPGETCVLTVNGSLVFDDDVRQRSPKRLLGEADGTTTAVVAAPCADVAANPPGTYPDAFQFQGRFQGTIAQTPVTAELTYAGRTHEGGEIDAVITLQGGASGLLRVSGQVAVGGTYSGWVDV